METNVIRRYRFDATDYTGIAQSGVEVIRARGEEARRSWHNVGSIGFTERGYLWALFGDNVCQASLRPELPLGVPHSHHSQSRPNGWV